MTWGVAEGIFELSFDTGFTSALAFALFLFGGGLKKRIFPLRRFCVPSGVIGGLSMAFCVFLLHSTRTATIRFDHTMQMPMIALFFTRIGISGSIRQLMRGGRTLITYLLFCWSFVLLQNTLGVVTAQFFGIHPVLGLMAGGVSLSGGHNLAGIFGLAAEDAGVRGSLAVATAAATYGLIVGGLLGAPLADWLIQRNRLQISPDHDIFNERYDQDENEAVDVNDFIPTLALFLALMALGNWGAERIQETVVRRPGWENFTFPGYLGSMLLAVLFRNFNDVFRMVRLRPRCMDLISTVSVSLFLTVSMMSLRIWELYGLALPLLLILVIQTLVIVYGTLHTLFPLMGGDYDAAIICSGFIGHGLGAPSSAVSTMRATCDQHNAMSCKAFLIVPLCASLLVDLVGLPCIIWMLSSCTR